MATIDSKLLVSDLAIVVVDDTKFGRAVFNSVLSKAGYGDIRVAGSAAQALELMAERRADVAAVQEHAARRLEPCHDSLLVLGSSVA